MPAINKGYDDISWVLMGSSRDLKLCGIWIDIQYETAGMDDSRPTRIL